MAEFELNYKKYNRRLLWILSVQIVALSQGFFFYPYYKLVDAFAAVTLLFLLCWLWIHLFLQQRNERIVVKDGFLFYYDLFGRLRLKTRLGEPITVNFRSIETVNGLIPFNVRIDDARDLERLTAAHDTPMSKKS